MKKNYLFVYDYGMGGVWGLMRANSKEEILEKYPSLIVVDERPSWMTEANFNNVVTKSSFDIDDPPSRWIVGLSTKGK